MATLAPSEHGTRSDVVGIMLVDDHAIVRQGLRSILEREDDLRVVGEASSASEALAVIGRANPHIVLLDLKLSTSSDSEGLELCQQLTAQYPTVGVLVLTTFLDEQLVLSAIRDVSRGESAFDARSAAAMVRGLNAPPVEEAKQLTAREFAAAGRTYRVFVAHDLHERNLALLHDGHLSAVLHHDLRQDMRHACQVIMQAHGALAGRPRSWHSAVQVVTPYNLPAAPQWPPQGDRRPADARA